MNNDIDNMHVDSENTTNTIGDFFWRLVTAAVILGITAFFTPGFTISSIWSLVLSALILTVIDYMIATFTGLRASAFGKGFVGFVLAAVILYITQYFVVGYSISWLAAIIGAIIYGAIDYFIPSVR